MICQHGDRRVVRLTADKKVQVVADRFGGKRYNSPDDVIVKSDGSIYFTDPPFGLQGHIKSPLRELPNSGLYRVDPSGKIDLLVEDLLFPNGLAFSPDEKRLYVTNSDWITPARNIIVYNVEKDGTLGPGRVFYDTFKAVIKGILKDKGLPDGVRVDRRGNVFCRGRAGCWCSLPTQLCWA